MHLFFECVFAAKVWFHVRHRAKMKNMPPCLLNIKNWLIACSKPKDMVEVVGKLVIAASIYFIWQERNNRLFNHQSRPPEVIGDKILETVRYKLMTLKYRKTNQVMKILEEWKIQDGNMFDDNG
ncbi:MAG: hypothetical protein Q8755_03050 [Candidatus Phytoplasma australasiaticum]|nr:hypothetical protein [Candidatus Phytoplasma australasiaticum]